MTLKKIHRWIGLALSIFLFVIGLTGTLLIWKKEYLWLTMPEARNVIENDAVSIAQAIESIENSYEKDLISLIALHSEGLSLHKVFLSDKSYAWHNQKGEKLQQWRGNERVEDWLLDLHHRFLLGNQIGLNIARYSGLALIPLLLFGLYIWWPQKQMLKLGLLPNKRQLRNLQRNALLRSHGNLGAVVLLPLLLVTITGVILVYPVESRSLLVENFVDTEISDKINDELDDLHGANEASWTRVIERSLEQHPNARLRWVGLPSPFSPYRIVGLQQQHGWNSSGQTAVYIDAELGHMAVNADAPSKPVVERLYNFSYPLHTGKLPFLYRLFLALTGLGLCTVSLFGVVTYLKQASVGAKVL